MSLGSGWYYNSLSGSVIYDPPIIGLPQASFPDWHGPFPTKAKAVAFGNAQAAAGKGKAPTGLIGAIGNTVTAPAKAAAGIGTHFVATQFVADLFTAGGSLNMFVRIGEVLLGLVLIAAGIAKMTSAVPIATKVAKTVGVAAI